MIEINSIVYLYALFSVVTIASLTFASAAFSFRINKLHVQAANLFELYFILGLIGWVGLFIKETQHIQVSLTPSTLFYVLCSLFLFLAVFECVKNRSLRIVVILLHVLLVILILVISDDVKNILIVSCYATLIYPVISFICIRCAYRLKNTGNLIMGLGALLAFCLAPVQIYALFAMNDINLSYGIAVSASAVGYILVGIGYLVSILINEHQNSVSLSWQDALTGLLNRRGLEKLLQPIISNLERKHLCVSVIILDIDYFKEVNDVYGHLAGDAVLKSIASALKIMIRSGDYFCRFGGEEFIVVLPETTIDTALEIAERFRQKIENLTVYYEGETINVTASFGVTSSSDNINLDRLIKNSDDALYEAKSEGRNRVIVMQG